MSLDFEAMYDRAVDNEERLERELTAALSRAEKAEAELAHMKANNRYQKGFHDGETSCRAERDEAQRQVDALCDVTDEAIGALEPIAGCKDIAEMLQQALAEARKANGPEGART